MSAHLPNDLTVLIQTWIRAVGLIAMTKALVPVVPGAVPQGENRLRDRVIRLTTQLLESKSRSSNEIQRLNRHCDNKDARFSTMKLALTQAKGLAESHTRSVRSELHAKV
jgi:hypothetical protein